MSYDIRLDARLSLAYELYDPCELAADIGTDHAHLPAALLQRGRCQHMILTDLSESALRNARNELIRFRLLDRVTLRAGDGLTPLEERCGMISVTGMGGHTIREILLSGKQKLLGATLVLSAHTDLPLIREAVNIIGYHLDREEPCFCAGRYYLVMRARPGLRSVTPREIRLGGPLFDSGSDQLIPWIKRRREVLEGSLHGLLSAEKTDVTLITRVREDIAAYNAFIEKGIKPYDSQGTV